MLPLVVPIQKRCFSCSDGSVIDRKQVPTSYGRQHVSATHRADSSTGVVNEYVRQDHADDRQQNPTRDLDARAPLPPATAFSIDSRMRGWYFSVKVWADAWPQDEYTEDRSIHGVLEEASRSGGKANLSLVLCKHDTREAQCNHLRLAMAMEKLANPDMATAMEEVALPALWQNLVHAANGRIQQYWLHGGVVQCECDAESFELGDPMKLAADLALSTQLGDSDINLQHPRALTALHELYDA
ncbi:hypothetical protein WJX84_011458 [Apatococcus fuscideae]|uniref:SWIM-type domain-containing protein n=1 Tax=Apatococcus fuscideae TaxID=2026836 RepID=A0AAW1TEG8_9CHLO